MKKIKRIIFDHKQIIHNLLNLGAIQFLNLLAPIIIYPLTLHRLGLDAMGVAIYYQGIVAFLAISINYGFYISGPKLISVAINENKNISEIVSSILLIKILIWILCLFIVLIISNIEYFNLNKEYILLSFLATFYELLFMQWFFQGVENLKPMVFINTISKIFQAVAIYSLVKSPSDINTYLLVLAVNNFIAGVLSIILAYSLFKLRIFIPSLASLKNIFLESGFLFLANITNSLKDRLSIILIGNHLGMSNVASYDLAIRIINISTMPINIIVDAFFPSIARNKNKNKIKTICNFSFILSLSFIIFEFIFIDNIIRLLSGNNNSISIYLAKIALLAIPLLSLSTVLGKLGLIAVGNNKDFLTIVIITSTLYLSLLFIGFSLNLLNEVAFYMIVTIFIYLTEFIFRLLFFKKRIFNHE